MAKRVSFRTKSGKKVSFTTKNKKNKSKSRTKNNVPRKRKSFARKTRRGFSSVGSSLRKGAVGEAVKGMGGSELATLVTDRVAPQYSGIASIGGGFLAGGPIGGIAAVVKDVIKGQFNIGVFGAQSSVSRL